MSAEIAKLGSPSMTAARGNHKQTMLAGNQKPRKSHRALSPSWLVPVTGLSAQNH